MRRARLSDGFIRSIPPMSVNSSSKSQPLTCDLAGIHPAGNAGSMDVLKHGALLAGS